jgi:hypothetical protein
MVVTAGDHLTAARDNRPPTVGGCYNPGPSAYSGAVADLPATGVKRPALCLGRNEQHRRDSVGFRPSSGLGRAGLAIELGQVRQFVADL